MDIAKVANVVVTEFVLIAAAFGCSVALCSLEGT